MLDVLRQHHAEIDGQFREIDEAPVGRRAELIDRLAKLLVAHAAIDRVIVYPALARLEEQAILRSCEELAIIEQCLAKLCEVRTHDRTFEAKVAVLEDIVRHHVDQEDDLLRKAAERLDDAALAGSVQERFAEVLASDHRALLAESVAASAATTFGPVDSERLHAAPAGAIPDEPNVEAPRRTHRTSGVRAKRVRPGMPR